MTHNLAFLMLMFHCCERDHVFHDKEIALILYKMSSITPFANLEFSTSLDAYNEIRAQFNNNEISLLQHLVSHISKNPEGRYGVLCHCIELLISDDQYTNEEAAVVTYIGTMLGIEELKIKHAVMSELAKKIVAIQLFE